MKFNLAKGDTDEEDGPKPPDYPPHPILFGKRMIQEHKKRLFEDAGWTEQTDPWQKDAAATSSASRARPSSASDWASEIAGRVINSDYSDYNMQYF